MVVVQIIVFLLGLWYSFWKRWIIRQAFANPFLADFIVIV
jgi:hypothetical protein